MVNKINQSINQKTRSATTTTLFKSNLTKPNLDSLKVAFEKTSWDHILNSTDTNIAFSLFSNEIENKFNSICPNSEVKFKPKELLQNPWMTNGLKKSSKRKQKLYNKFLKSRSIIDERNYNSYKNMFQKILKKAKSNYYSGQFNKHKSDSKKTWQIIKEVTGRQKISKDCLPKVIKQDGITIHNKHKICSEFNKFL